MKNILILLLSVFVVFACSKNEDQPQEDHKNVNRKGAKVVFGEEEEDDFEEGFSGVAANGSNLGINLGYNSLSTIPSINYYAETVIPTIGYPTYDEIVEAYGENAVSEQCYNEAMSLVNEMESLQPVSISNQDEFCRVTNKLIEVAKNCHGVETIDYRYDFCN